MPQAGCLEQIRESGRETGKSLLQIVSLLIVSKVLPFGAAFTVPATDFLARPEPPEMRRSLPGR